MPVHGFFESETVYSTAVSTSRVFTEEAKDSLKQTIVTSIYSESDINEHIRSALLAGMVNSIQLYHRQGKLTYINRLPEVAEAPQTLDLSVVEDQLQPLLGNITVIAAYSGHIDSEYWVKYYLQENHGYLVSDNQFIRYFPGGIREPFTTFVRNSDGTFTVITIINSFNPFIIPAVPSDNMYAVLYYPEGSQYPKYWVYDVNLGGYDLSSASDGGSLLVDYGLTPMLPIIRLRSSFNFVKEGTPEYDTAEPLLKHVNLNMDTLITAVEGDESNDIRQVRDVFFLFGLNIYTESQAGKKALFLIFQSLEKRASISRAEWEAYKAFADSANLFTIKSYLRITQYIYNEIVIREGNYNTRVIFGFIEITTEEGSLENEYEVEYFGAGETSSFIIKKRISGSIYTQIYIRGLILATDIRVADGEVQTTNAGVSTDPLIQRNAVLPLSLNLATSPEFSYFEKETIIQESCILTMYAEAVTELEFYETEKFNRLLGGVLTFLTLATLVVTGIPTTWTGWAELAFRTFLTSIALNFVVTKALEAAGDDNKKKALVLIAATAAAFYFGRKYGGLSTAQAMLEATRIALQVIVIDVGIQGEALEQEERAFLIDAEERNEEVQKLADLLDVAPDLEYWEIVTYFNVYQDEAPEDFYARTIHTGNPGVLVLDEISTFHDRLLELPTIDLHSFDPVSAYT